MPFGEMKNFIGIKMAAAHAINARLVIGEYIAHRYVGVRTSCDE